MKRKGFTLAELVVVLAVSAVVLASLTVMVATITSVQRIRSEEQKVEDELFLAETRLSNWFAAYDASSYPAPSVPDGGASLVCGAVGEEVTAEHRNHVLYVGNESYPTTFIQSVTFAADPQNPGLFKCTVTYASDKEDISGEYVFLLLKRSITESETAANP